MEKVEIIIKLCKQYKSTLEISFYIKDPISSSYNSYLMYYLEGAKVYKLITRNSVLNFQWWCGMENETTLTSYDHRKQIFNDEKDYFCQGYHKRQYLFIKIEDLIKFMERISLRYFGELTRIDFLEYLYKLYRKQQIGEIEIEIIS